jgi:hypothetical protein
MNEIACLSWLEDLRPKILNSTQSEAWVLGFDRVTGLSGSILFINQNNIILVKKKTKSQQVTTWLFFSIFLNPIQFQSRINQILDRHVEPCRVSKLYLRLVAL